MNHGSTPGVCTPQTQPTNVTMAAGHILQLAGLNPKGWDRADTNHCLHRLGQPLPYMEPEAVFVCTQEVTFKRRHTSARTHKDAKTPDTRSFIRRVPPCTAFLVFASRYQKKKRKIDPPHVFKATYCQHTPTFGKVASCNCSPAVWASTTECAAGPLNLHPWAGTDGESV